MESIFNESHKWHISGDYKVNNTINIGNVAFSCSACPYWTCENKNINLIINGEKKATTNTNHIGLFTFTYTLTESDAGTTAIQFHFPGDWQCPEAYSEIRTIEVAPASDPISPLMPSNEKYGIWDLIIAILVIVVIICLLRK